MDTFELNKIAGAFLGSLLLLMVINEIGNLLVHPTHPEKPAIAIEMPEGPAAAATATASKEPEKPLAALLASADAAAGAKQAKKCATCHNFEAGAGNKIGPHLHNVVGRQKASVADFSYSSGMKEKGGSWTYEDLFHFLKDPRSFVSGTKMTFAGLKKPEDRADVILYLRQQTDSPPPLPTQ
jgi:cytochrome c